MHVVAHRQIRTVLEQQIHHLFVSVVRGKVQSGCVVWNSAHPRPPVEQKRDGCPVLVLTRVNERLVEDLLRIG